MEDLYRLLDDYDDLDLGQLQVPPTQPRVKVRPVVRGEAMEFHLGKLANKGYIKLPNNYRGIDAIKGDYSEIKKGKKRIKVYKKSATVSIKSTHVTNPKKLLREFRKKYLPNSKAITKRSG